MKKISILLLLAVASLTQLAAQNTRTSIENRVNSYFEATERKDWNAVVDMVYPKLFNIATKEQMVEVFESIESEGMKMDMKNFSIQKISDVITHEGEKFATVDYDMLMSIQFTSVEYRDSSVQEMIKASFDGLYGAENVNYDPAAFSFDISASRTMFAIANEGTMDWYFIENDPSQKELTEMLVPAAVREKLMVNRRD